MSALFSRSSIGGKKSSEIKARVSDETKLALQRRCHELGITESEYLDKLVNISLFGIDEVMEAERKRAQGIVGLWHKLTTTENQ